MPITSFDNLPNEKQEIIERLSTEIDYFYSKMKEMKQVDDTINSGIDLLERYKQTFDDDSRSLRYIAHFIAIQTFENNATLKDMLLSSSVVDDIPLMKKGIGNLKEGCKLLIGFYTTKNGVIKDTLITESLLYQIHNKVKNDYPELYQKTETIINNFRNKVEGMNIKDVRDELTHYQKDKGNFNPFNFTATAFQLDCNEVYQLLFDYCIFLRLITGYVNCLMKLGYK